MPKNLRTGVIVEVVINLFLVHCSVSDRKHFQSWSSRVLLSLVENQTVVQSSIVNRNISNSFHSKLYFVFQTYNLSLSLSFILIGLKFPVELRKMINFADDKSLFRVTNHWITTPGLQMYLCQGITSQGFQ